MPDGEGALDAKLLSARVDRVIATLPETQRVAFELVKRDGLSMHEAAMVLGVSEGAVKLRAHRAYEALRHALSDVVKDRGADES